MPKLILPPDLERFAAESVADLVQDIAKVVAAGVSLLRRQEQARAELRVSVLAAKAESDRDGCLTCDEVAELVWATIARRANDADLVG